MYTLSADRRAGLCPAYAECQDAMQQLGVFDSVMLGRSRELLAFGYFRIGIGFNEIGSAVGREAKVDTCVSIQPHSSADAFRCSLDARRHVGREVFGRSVHDSDARLVIGIVLG